MNKGDIQRAVAVTVTWHTCACSTKPCSDVMQWGSMSLDANTGGGFRYLSIHRLQLFLSEKLQAVLILDELCVASLPVPVFCVDASPT